MVGKAGAVVVFQHRMRRDASLYDDVIDVIPQLFNVVTFLLQIFIYRCDPPEITVAK